MNFNIPKLNIPSVDAPEVNIPNIHMPELPQKMEPIKNYTPKSVLVLGNGFDIDLGINTRYENFVESCFWPFDKTNKYEENSLPFFLNECLGEIDTWYDLEEALAKFAGKSTKHLDGQHIVEAKNDFATLCKALEIYLQNQEDSFVKKMEENKTARRMRPAHYLLNYFLKKDVRSIYTFNYTNVRRIARQFILDFDDEYTHIHGSLKNSNIILGTGDQRNLNDKFFDFYKSANPHYESNNLVEDLNTADEVYIFGHSLGLNDHDYFSEFFKMASKAVHRPFAPNKIKVRIFTFDDRSEMAIKKQLMNLTENHLIGLYAHCNFKILKTCNKYQDEWILKDDVL